MEKIGINLQGRDKRLFETYNVVSIDGEMLIRVIDARFTGTLQRAYCNVWIKHRRNDITTNGTCAGYGVDMKSGAFYSALKSANIVDEDSVHYNIETTLTKIAESLGYKNIHIIRGYA